MGENGNMSDKFVSYEEQIRLGLVRPPPNNFVLPAKQGDILPPIRHVPAIMDPYAPAMPQAAQHIANYEATPITRAQAMRMKIRDITLFLAVLTGAAMYAFQLYPATWQTFGIFMLWLMFACTEGLLTFIVLAILDYRETPAAMTRMQWHDYARMMDREQAHRLRAMYPEQYTERSKRK
jgi:hypothetical protein